MHARTHRYTHTEAGWQADSVACSYPQAVRPRSIAPFIRISVEWMGDGRWATGVEDQTNKQFSALPTHNVSPLMCLKMALCGMSCTRCAYVQCSSSICTNGIGNCSTRAMKGRTQLCQNNAMGKRRLFHSAYEIIKSDAAAANTQVLSVRPSTVI